MIRRGGWNRGLRRFDSIEAPGRWRLYWQRASLRWEAYEPLLANRDLAMLVAEIDRDPHGCFFG
jgi:hypothetical protein